MTETISIRLSSEADSAALSALHREAWRHAYAGIIPGIALERMLGRRGPKWWRALHRSGGCVLVIDIGDGPCGYAMLGASRGGSAGTGEVYEIYLRPECQGVGLGRRLFDASRQRLRERGLPRTVVWALADNTLACRFYEAVGGRPFRRERTVIGNRALEKVGYVWN